MKLAAHDGVLSRLSAAVQTPPFEPTQDTVLTPGPEGRLVFSAFRIPAGVRVSFEGAGDAVTIVSRGDLVVDGALDAGGRSLTLDGPSIAFGSNHALIESARSLNINAPRVDPGMTRTLRGNVFLNGARLSTAEIGNGQPGTISSGTTTRFVPGWNAESPSGSGATPWITASTGPIGLGNSHGTISPANAVVGSGGEGPSTLVVAASVAPPAPFLFATAGVTAVPEPGAWVLLLAGTAALLIHRFLQRDRAV